MQRRQTAPKQLSLVQFCYWGGTTVMVGFMVSFLRDAGYSDVQSGLVASCVAAGTLLLQPLFGYISDSVFPARRLLMACFAAGMPIALILPVLEQGLLLSACVVGLSLLCEPQATLLDNYIIRMKEKAPEVDYGRVRAWGPMGSATAALLAGGLGYVASLRPMFYLAAGFFVLCFILLWRCDEVGCPNKEGGRGSGKAAGFWEAVRMLIKNPAYVLFIGCCCLFQFAMRTATTFLGIVVIEQGGGSLELGLLLCVVYAGQMPFMRWAGRRLNAGVGCEKMFGIAMALGTLRLSLLGLQLPFYVMLVTQLLQAAQTGLYTRMFVQHITNITEPHIHATAASVGAAVSLGVGQLVGGVVHGRVIEAAGAGASALLSAGVMAGTLALYTLVSRRLSAPEKSRPAKA